MLRATYDVAAPTEIYSITGYIWHGICPEFSKLLPDFKLISPYSDELRQSQTYRFVLLLQRLDRNSKLIISFPSYK
jgi:hypothetical protein